MNNAPVAAATLAAWLILTVLEHAYLWAGVDEGAVWAWLLATAVWAAVATAVTRDIAAPKGEGAGGAN